MRNLLALYRFENDLANLVPDGPPMRTRPEQSGHVNFRQTIAASTGRAVANIAPGLSEPTGWLEIPHHLGFMDGDGPLTVEFFTRPQAIPTTLPVLTTTTIRKGVTLFQMRQERFHDLTRPMVTLPYGITALFRDQGSHIAIIKDGEGRGRMFVNGQTLDKHVTIPVNSYPLTIGLDRDRAHPFILDDLRIANEARYPVSFHPPVKPLSHRTLTPFPSDVQVHLSFNEHARNDGIVPVQPSGVLTYGIGLNDLMRSASLYSAPIAFSADALRTEALTVEAWMQMTQEKTEMMTLLSAFDAEGAGVAYSVRGEGDGRVSLAVHTTRWTEDCIRLLERRKAFAAASVTIERLDNPWAHVAFVRAGDHISIFVNGSLVLSSSVGQFYPLFAPMQGTVAVIGAPNAHDRTGARPFTGRLSEFRVTSRVIYPFVVPKGPLPL